MAIWGSRASFYAQTRQMAREQRKADLFRQALDRDLRDSGRDPDKVIDRIAQDAVEGHGNVLAR